MTSVTVSEPRTASERPHTGQTTDQTAIRPFRFEAPEAELVEMRRRITATRFPEKETVADFSQGVQLAFIQVSIVCSVRRSVRVAGVMLTSST